MKQLYIPKVDRYTRAGRNGKAICCPKCKGIVRVYHFSWSAISCLHCKQSVDKSQWSIV